MMSTATAPTRPNNAPATTNGQSKIDESRLLEAMLDMSVTDQVRQMALELEHREQEIEFLLPDFMKGQAKRILKRARLTFAGNERLQECTPASFLKCVLQAAEMGFAIDGRLCHAVPYKKSWQDADKRWQSQYEAQTQVDYKGMIAHAKRLGLVQDCWSRLVHEKDHFRFMEKNGIVDYEFAYTMDQDPGPVLGAFAVATHKDGWTRFEWMSLGEIHQIRARSKSWGTEGGKGPWQDHPGEMIRKTPTKRLLKTMTDDAGLIRMLELDDGDTDLTRPPAIDTSEKTGVDRAFLQQIISTVGQKTEPAKQISTEKSVEPRQRSRETAQEPSQSSQEPKRDPKPVETAKLPPTQLSSTDGPPDTLAAFSKYREQLEACETDQQCRHRYDGWFGPDSTVEFTPDQDKQAAAMRDAMIEHIRQTTPQMPERMRLLKEKIGSYKQPARLSGLATEVAADPSFSPEEKQMAQGWISQRVQALQGNLALGG
jgi:phage RecT family recombinase